MTTNRDVDRSDWRWEVMIPFPWAEITDPTLYLTAPPYYVWQPLDPKIAEIGGWRWLKVVIEDMTFTMDSLVGPSMLPVRLSGDVGVPGGPGEMSDELRRFLGGGS